MLDQLDDPVAFVADDTYLAGVRRRGAQLRRRRRAVRLAALVPVLAVVVAAAGVAWVDHRVDQVDRVTIASGVLTPAGPGEPRNVLVVGTDGPEGTVGARADTIMLVHLDPTQDLIRVVSVPRDLELADGRKVSDELPAGGPDGLITAVSQALGVPVSHYVAVDFTGFVRLFDAAGGVTVQVPVDWRDTVTGLQLPPGCQHLDGSEALALVRSRHGEVRDQVTGQWSPDTSGDFGRMRLQRVVLGEVVGQLQARAADPSTLEGLLTVFADNTTVDAGLGRSELLDLARWGLGVGAGHVFTATIPAMPAVRADGTSVLQLGASAPEDVTAFLDGNGPLDTPPVTSGQPEITACTGS